MFSEPADAYEDIANRVLREEAFKRIAISAELGVPVEITARSIVFAGWAQGKYTVDVMYLIYGPVFEMMMAMLDKSGVEYTALATRKEDESLTKMMDMLEKRKEIIGEKVAETDDEELKDDEELEEDQAEDEVPTSGLMGRPE